MVKKLIIIGVAVLLVAGAVYWFFFKPPAPPTPSFYVPGDYFITNVKDSQKLLKTTIVLALERDDMEEFLIKHTHVIRDVIVFVLRDKTEEELRATDIQDALRREITNQLENSLAIDYITTIYFNDFILQ